MRISFRRRTLDLRRRVAVVAVINVTPDSYVAGSRFRGADAVLARAETCLSQGADILEIGGESTGPGSVDVADREELRRVLPAVRAIRRAFPEVWIAVDTWKAAVAGAVLDAGADIINDVTAGRGDRALFAILADAACPCVLMHAKDATPRTTARAVAYDDIVAAVRRFLLSRIRAAGAAGVRRDRIIVDPGLGHFLSSDPAYSFEILDRLGELTDLAPVLVSPSRKSFLAGPEALPVRERLPATLSATALAVVRGAGLIRTHDVAETRRTVDACRCLRSMHEA